MDTVGINLSVCCRAQVAFPIQNSTKDDEPKKNAIDPQSKSAKSK